MGKDVKWDDTNFRLGVKIKSRAALRLLCEHVRNEAKEIITQKNLIVTGNLRRSITYRLEEEELIGWVGTNVEYAPYVELGHRIKRGGKVIGHAPAYPYLRPAFDSLDQKAVDKIVNRIK